MTGARFREIRDELGLTQAQLTRIISVQPATISDYENDRRKTPAKLGLALEALREIHRLGGDIHAPAKRAAQ